MAPKQALDLPEHATSEISGLFLYKPYAQERVFVWGEIQQDHIAADTYPAGFLKCDFCGISRSEVFSFCSWVTHHTAPSATNKIKGNGLSLQNKLGMCWSDHGPEVFYPIILKRNVQ